MAPEGRGALPSREGLISGSFWVINKLSGMEKLQSGYRNTPRWAR